MLTEHWDLYKRPNGEEWLTITTQIEDPQYLRNVRLVAPVFKKEPDGSKWDPDSLLVYDGERRSKGKGQRSKVRAKVSGQG